jgi:uncharacterized protein
MSAEANRAAIQAVFEAWQAGRGALPDVGPFGARFARGERFRPVRVRSVLADGDTVVAIWDGRGVANDGKPYENSYAFILRMRDGEVVDGTAFFDSISFNDLWTRVTPPA